MLEKKSTIPKQEENKKEKKPTVHTQEEECELCKVDQSIIDQLKKKAEEKNNKN